MPTLEELFRGQQPEVQTQQPIDQQQVSYGQRADGTQKGKGFLGELKRPDGRVSTELSIGVDFDGKQTEIPTLVPTLSEQEKSYLLSTPEDKIFTTNPLIYRQIQQKAVEHAKKRMQEGKSPFYSDVESQPTQPEIGAANTQNKAIDFNSGSGYIATPKADEDYLPLQIMNNNQVTFLQKDKRSPQQRAAIAKFMNKSYGTAIPETGDPNTEPLITDAYIKNQGTVPAKLIEHGYISQKQATQATPAPKTAADIAKEAAATGKSFLQLYQESMPKPEYEQEQADRIQTNSKASIIADILKLVGEGVTTKKGGTPIVRQSAVPMLNAELQKLNDLYKNEVRAYKQGGFNALLMDEQEKKRALIQKARDEAAKAVKQMEIDAAAKKDEAAKKFDIDKLDKQQKFTATENAKNRSTTLTAAQIRKQDSENKSTTNEKGDILIDGKIVKPKQAYVNDVTAKVRSTAGVSDPVMGMSPTEVFAANWNKYYDYKNGEFVPKGKSTTTGDTLNLGIKKTKSNPLGLNL